MPYDNPLSVRGTYVHTIAAHGGPDGLMAPGLFDPNLKRGRAQMHLQEFNDRCILFAKTHRPKISTEDDLEHGLYIHRTQHARFDASVLTIALVAGDFIANLRGSLDHLAWQLVRLNRESPHTGTAFPVCEVDTSDSRKYFSKCTRGMGSTAVGIIEKFQPYHAGNDFRLTALWRINKLWNIDKHRHFYPHAIASTWHYHLDPGVEPLQTFQVENSTVTLFRLADKAHIHLNPEIAAEFRLFDRAEDMEVGSSEFTDLYNFVTDEVFPAFAGLFPDPMAEWKP